MEGNISEHNILSECLFNINSETKNIEKPENMPVLVQGSHNSTRFSFSMPRVINGHDMLHSEVEIHYTVTHMETCNIACGVYEVEDLCSTEDAEKLTFSWSISKNATRYWGGLCFSIHFKCTDYEWNTLDFAAVPVYPSMNNTEEIMTEHPDIMCQILEKIKTSSEETVRLKGDTEKNAISIKTLFRELETLAKDIDETKPDWFQNNSSKRDYIKNRPFYDEVIERKTAILSFYANEIDESGYIEIKGDTLGLRVGQTYNIKVKGYKEGELLFEHDAPTIDAISYIGIPSLQYRHQDSILSWLDITDRSSTEFFEKNKDAVRFYYSASIRIITYNIEEIYGIADCDRYEIIMTGAFSGVNVHPIDMRFIGYGNIHTAHLSSATREALLMNIKEEHIPSTIARVADVDKKIEDNRLAYDREEDVLIGTGEFLYDEVEYWYSVYIEMDDGITLVEGDHLLFEITSNDGESYQDEIVSLGETYDGGMEFKSRRTYSWEGNTIYFIEHGSDRGKLSVKVYRRSGSIKKIDEKLLPDIYAYVKIGAKSEGYMNGYLTEHIRPGDTLKIKVIPSPTELGEPAYEYEETFSTAPMRIVGKKGSQHDGEVIGTITNKFLDGNSLYTVELYKRMPFPITKVVTEIKESVNLTSPNGTKYKITVADDGTLTTTSIES